MKTGSDFRGVLLITAVNLFSQLARFSLQALLSRAVTAETLGLYQLVLSVQPVLMSLTAVGAVSACTQLSARYDALGNRVAVRQIPRACLGVFLLACSVLTLVFLPLRSLIAQRFLGEPRAADGLLLLLPLVLLTGIENIHKGFFYGIGSIKEPACVEIGEQLIRLGAVFGLLRYFSPVTPNDGVLLILFGMLLCELFSSCALALLVLRRSRRTASGALLPRETLKRNIAAIALPMGGNALLGNLMGTWTVALIPRLLTKQGISAEAALSALGVLRGMTLPLLALPTVALAALTPVLLPKIARAAACRQTERCRGHIANALTAVSLWSFPTASLLAVLAPTLGRLIFKTDTVGEFAVPFALALMAESSESVLSVSLCGLGKQSRAATLALLTGAVRLFLTWALMPRFGLSGYATATVCSALLGLFLHVRSLNRLIDFRPPWFSALTAPALSALLAALCVKLLLPMLAPLGEWLSCCGAFLFGAVLYLCSLTATGVFPAFFRQKC